MNKYLEKIAKANDTQSSAAKNIIKKATMNPDTKRDAIHTGTIFGLGALGSAASAVIGKKIPKIGSSIAKMTAVGSGIALGTDLAAVKLNKKMDNKL